MFPPRSHVVRKPKGAPLNCLLCFRYLACYHFAFDISVLSDTFTTVLFEVKFSRSIWIIFKLKLKTCITILASQTATNMFLKQTTKPRYGKTTRRAIIIYRIYMGDHFLKINYGQSSTQLSTQAGFNCFCGCLRHRRCLTKFLIKRNSMDATFTCISTVAQIAMLIWVAALHYRPD